MGNSVRRKYGDCHRRSWDELAVSITNYNTYLNISSGFWGKRGIASGAERGGNLPISGFTWMPWEVRAQAAIRSGAVPVKIGNDEDFRRRARTVDLHSRKSQQRSDDFLIRLKNED
jgi:hypothetical protein